MSRSDAKVLQELRSSRAHRDMLINSAHEAYPGGACPPDVDPALYWAGRMYIGVVHLLSASLSDLLRPQACSEGGSSPHAAGLRHAARMYNEEIMRRAAGGHTVAKVSSEAGGLKRCTWINLASELPDEERDGVRERLADLFAAVWDVESDHVGVEFV